MIMRVVEQDKINIRYIQTCLIFTSLRALYQMKFELKEDTIAGSFTIIRPISIFSLRSALQIVIKPSTFNSARVARYISL